MRLIDADALSAKMYHDAFETDTDMQKWDNGCWIRYKMFENAMDSTPTIDVLEVVRCKDCKWWSEVDEDNGKKFGECKHPSYVISDTVFINEDWYCADGERK